MRPLAALVLALLLLAAAGCGEAETVAPMPETVTGELPEAETPDVPEGDPEAGAEVFAEAGCGGCHVLADAGSTGTVGPNLDEAQPDLETAVQVITNGRGVMPAFRGQLDDQQIADVATYVVEATSR